MQAIAVPGTLHQYQYETSAFLMIEYILVFVDANVSTVDSVDQPQPVGVNCKRIRFKFMCHEAFVLRVNYQKSIMSLNGDFFCKTRFICLSSN